MIASMKYYYFHVFSGRTTKSGAGYWPEQIMSLICWMLCQPKKDITYRVKQNYLSGSNPPWPILTQKPVLIDNSIVYARTKTVREEVILAKEGISLKDNSAWPCSLTKFNNLIHLKRVPRGIFLSFPQLT